ncbi:calcium-binding protein [Pelagibacterium halotolerans]|uniref:5'-nucleotidase n=1 Tax=Pelagibacterium halotolerans (strain DSM 22347 / JCM 15775 / CGMCC 1.7692 / B2) TaxID=1082931 RepID=G4RB81_PELHB|nr:cadherin-like domain-containing protein [Pelagibacterium halotolerans]AEQ51579.1 5'-nucleotidase [Pelagibacterium halotolerans B2]QJR18591.1 calcium-binding protein [Pelagibacterium halotolerans]SEA17415.1 Ca2+-binding protein, RTX toxin-related [Pelagibacterium halotolerans]
MIGAKGARQPEAEGTAASDRYAFAEAQGLNRIPMLFGLMVTGIVAYLKLALAPAHAAQTIDTPAPERDEDQTAAPVIANPPDKLDDYRKKAGNGEAAEHLAPPLPQDFPLRVGNVVGFPGPRFELADSSTIDFSTLGSMAEPTEQTAIPDIPAPLRTSDGLVPPTRLVPGQARPEEPPTDIRRNRAPEASGPVRLNDVVAGAAALIGLDQLLANVVDPDGDNLEVSNLRVSTGSIGWNGEAWVYSSHAQTPDSEVVIRFKVSDGAAVIDHTASFRLEREGDMVGTDQLDHLVGANLADAIDARGGNDLIDARGGDDIVFGGAGDDLIVAGAGHDHVYGGLGNDRIFGGPGNDILSGGGGDDQIFGEDGDDTILGEHGNDRLFGGAGDDFISGGAGNDLLGDGAGADKMLGDAGDDTIIVSADAAPDVFDGGAGSDTLDLSVATKPVLVDLEEQSAQGEEIGEDKVANFEIVIGGSGDDLIAGDAASEALHGGGGDDEIHDGAGSDTVEGGEGDDRIVVALDADDDTFDGGEGADQLDLSDTTVGVTVNLETGQISSVEIGNDTVTGFEEVLGGAGNDMFHVGDQAVVLTGGPGNDTFSFGLPLAQVMDRPQVIHDILDFLVGDRILVAEYEFSTTWRDGEDNRFDYYFHGEDAEEDPTGLRLRIRYEIDENVEQTLLEFDFSGNREFDLVVAIDGQHQPYLYEHATI